MEFKRKLSEKEQLKYYFSPKNRKTRDPKDTDRKYHLNLIKQKDLKRCPGLPKIVEIEAGNSFETIIEVSEANSIVCISIQTLDYDIQFGLF